MHNVSFSSHFLMCVPGGEAFDCQIWQRGVKGGWGGGGGQEFEHANHQQFKCQRVACGGFEV